jgi:AcrR family transcriptional regulator
VPGPTRTRASSRSRARQSPEARRRQILDAGLDLFARRGYDGASVADIARQAGVATGTVYLYFPSKEQLLRALHHEFHAGLHAAVTDTAAALIGELERDGTLDARRGVEGLIRALGRWLLANRALCSVIVRYIPRLGEELPEERELVDVVAGILEEGVRRGVADVADPRMAAELVCYGIREPLGRFVTEGSDDDVERFLDQAVEFIAKALRPVR